jgi:Fe-S-cluster containining protein
MTVEDKLRSSAKRVLPIYRDIDIAVTRIAERAKATCRIGCNYCCYQLVPLTSLEAAGIITFVLDNELLKEELRELCLTLETQATFIERYEVGDFEHPDWFEHFQKLRTDYWDLHMPCAFLDRSKGTCRIYPVRPIACRTYMVQSDPALCHPSYKGDVAMIQVRDEDGGDIDTWAAERLTETMSRAGAPIIFSLLPPLLLSVLEGYKKAKALEVLGG